MGTTTFSEFKDQLKFELGERTDLSSHSTLGDLYGDWIDLGYLTLVTSNDIQGVKRSLYFPELFTEDTSQSTADGTATVNKPTDALYVEGVIDTTSDFEMENISWKEYKGYTGRSNSDSRATPREWTRRGDLIYMHPTPDAVYAITIYYYKRPAVLTGTDVTAIGKEWDEAVLKLSVVFGLMKLKRYEEAAVEKKAWIQLLEGITGMYDKERRDRDRQLRVNVYDRNYRFKR